MRRDIVAQMAAEVGARYFVHVMASNPIDLTGLVGNGRTMKDAYNMTYLMGKETKYALKGKRPAREAAAVAAGGEAATPEKKRRKNFSMVHNPRAS